MCIKYSISTSFYSENFREENNVTVDSVQRRETIYKKIHLSYYKETSEAQTYKLLYARSSLHLVLFYLISSLILFLTKTWIKLSKREELKITFKV